MSTTSIPPAPPKDADAEEKRKKEEALEAEALAKKKAEEEDDDMPPESSADEEEAKATDKELEAYCRFNTWCDREMKANAKDAPKMTKLSRAKEILMSGMKHGTKIENLGGSKVNDMMWEDVLSELQLNTVCLDDKGSLDDARHVNGYTNDIISAIKARDLPHVTAMIDAFRSALPSV